ncbi:MAG: metallophosphoesterase [Candidatus Promineifilaceae bacterium]
MKLSRRAFLQLGGAAATGAAASYIYGFELEPLWLQVENVTVTLSGLPPALDGFKIVHLSDLHLSSLIPLSLIERAVQKTNALRPDLVVLTGDFVLETAEHIFELAPMLAKLNAKHGVFSVLGNHDYWTNVAVVEHGLYTHGIPVFTNTGRLLSNGLYLAGVDDAMDGKPDIQAALADAPTNAPVVLLSHEPDVADKYMRNGRVALQLSGHSHGGQVRLPGRGPLILPPLGRKYHTGLYRVGDGWLYTTRGIGMVKPAVRLNCPPEITQITLTRG